ncbi:MAG: aconitate hydratase, partial [Chlamydiia bacterium]|nr:aconitate hydratase [Chlamydiia bacterium]
GGLGHIIEYYGPGLKCLSAMDRHVIANMGAELGATTSVFPSDEEVKRFMTAQGRGDEWVEILPDPDVTYERNDEINLSELEPLIACPSSPGNVVPVREVAGKEVYQVMIGSSANPGYRDFALPAEVIRDKVAHDRVSVDINPTSRQILENLIVEGHLENLVRAGARIHQAGCNGCIGMGQAPATQKISLRTVPRNFPGRSGTKEDAVYLCSPETAIAAAITGEITDPRDLGVPYPKVKEPEKVVINTSMLLSPTDIHADIELMKGPNIKELPHFDPLPPALEGPCLIKVGNDVSTDEIMPAGSRVLPYRSNIPEISKFTFAQIDESYYSRTLLHRDGGHFVVGGANYGQGSSREHAAIAPRYLGVRAVLVISYARIHWENLINFGILPLEFVRPEDYDDIKQMDQLHIPNLIHCLKEGEPIVVENLTKKRSYQAKHRMSKKEVEMILAGGAINQIKS